MRVLQIGADRSKRGVLVPGSPAFARQKAYAEAFGALDIISFSLKRDGFVAESDAQLRTHPTNSRSRLFFLSDAVRLAAKLPWPDVVSAQDPFETGLAALLVSRAIDVPLHVQVHTDFLAPAYARLSLKNRFRVLLASIVLKRAARIRVVSECIKVSIEKRYGLKTHISVLPIYAEMREPLPLEQAIVSRFAAFETKLLFVGRLEREKNAALAIESFAAMAPKSACLIIVGNGSERGHLERLVRIRGMGERVFFEGEKAASQYFPLIDLLLVTSHYEGYGLALVEALARGKPVLATDVGAAREAGAMIARAEHYAAALKAWFTDGPRTGELRLERYGSFEAYVQAYCADIGACVEG